MTSQEYSQVPRAMDAEVEHGYWNAYVRMKQREFSLVAPSGSEDPTAEREYAYWTAFVRMKQDDYLRGRRRNLHAPEAFEQCDETDCDDLCVEPESDSRVEYWFSSHRYDDADDWGGEVSSPFDPDSSSDQPYATF